MADACNDALREIFAVEARAHLAQVGAGLALLADGGAATALAPMLHALHTLGGAARAVELRELEWLCHALERVLHAAPGAALAPDHLDLLADAVALAATLPGEPGGRSGQRALTVVAQLDALARQLGAAAGGDLQPAARIATS
ncbi:MAG: Hpt domain-containing protein [Pseudomonadota bacterium]